MIFDTSLFEKNDPKLAKEVKKISIYFKGVHDKKLSWIEAKHLVKNAHIIIQEINAFANTKPQNGLDVNEFDKVYNYIKAQLNKAKTLSRFMALIKAGNRIYNNKIQVIP